MKFHSSLLCFLHIFLQKLEDLKKVGIIIIYLWSQKQKTKIDLLNQMS